MTDMLTTAVLIERVDAMDAEELDRLQAAIDRRRRQLDGDEVVPTTGPSSIVVERRAYGKTDAPEIKLAQIKGGIGG
jgi:hypothetical protein